MHRKINHLLISIFIFFMLGIAGCGSDGGGGTSGSGDDSGEGSTEIGDSGGSTEIGNPVLAGLVQKGPFYKGAKVVVQELDDADLMPTGIEHVTEAINDLGEFTFDGTIEISSSYVEISATGYYFNEISGIDSTQSLTLSALVDINKTKEININILTTIAVKREKYLIAHGKTYEEAKIQAQQEVITAFKFTEEDTDTPIVEAMDTFTQMDIGQDGTKNAVLLSLSILLQNFQERFSMASVSQAIDLISTDLETDGVCDKDTFISMLFLGADKIDLAQIRQNLETYFGTLANWFIIPDFESIFEKVIIPRIPMSAPIFSHASGTYNTDMSVEIFSPTKNATIHYSINDGEPEVYENPIDISGNGSIVKITTWSTVSFIWRSDDVSSYYLIDYDYEDDTSEYKADMTIEDFQSNIVGTWIGHIDPPLERFSPDSVKVTFDSTGEYTAEKTSLFIDSVIPFINIIISPAYEQLGSNLWYGTEFNLGAKIIDINEIADDGKAMADLALHSINGEISNAGKFLNIALSDDFNHLQYEFQCNALPNVTFTFYLSRLIE